MDYLELNCKIIPNSQIAVEILIAELGAAGFESFTENETGVTAYIQENDWREDILEDIQLLQSEEVEITYDIKEIEQVKESPK